MLFVGTMRFSGMLLMGLVTFLVAFVVLSWVFHLSMLFIVMLLSIAIDSSHD